MKPPPPLPTPPEREAREPARERFLPLEEGVGEGSAAPEPELETALDDEEGGADPIDPDTGLPYGGSDPGEAGPPADRQGGTPAV